MSAYTGANSTPVNPPSPAAQIGALNAKAVTSDVKALGPLLGDPYRGQGSGNGVTGGQASSRPGVVIAPPASRVAVPMPTGGWGTSTTSAEMNRMSPQETPGYLSPQERIAQVSVVGDRGATNLKSSAISVVTPVSTPMPPLYVPSGRKVR